MVAGGTAWHVALRRAAHQLLDHPRLMDDPFAVPLLGTAGLNALRRTPRSSNRAWSRSLRAFAVARSRFAEQQLAVAFGAGVRQYCLLGAGLDTFALRNPWPQLRVFELDQPQMLVYKRHLMRQAALPMPGCLTQVPADLSALPAVLPSIDHDRPCFFAMLGVAPYLEAAALREILARVRTYGSGSGIVFDYRLPRALLREEEQRQHDSLTNRLNAAGEPFRSFSAAEDMTALLSSFSRSSQLAPKALNALYFSCHNTGLCVLGDAVQLAIAWV